MTRPLLHFERVAPFFVACKNMETSLKYTHEIHYLIKNYDFIFYLMSNHNNIDDRPNTSDSTRAMFRPFGSGFLMFLGLLAFGLGSVCVPSLLYFRGSL